MLTRNDLKAIKGLLKPLGTDVGTLKVDVGGLKTDVGVLKLDVGTLKTDVGVLKSDVGTLKSDVGTLKSDALVLKTDVKDIKSNGINLQSDMKIVRSDIKLLHRKTDKFMAKTNANTRTLKTYKNVVQRKFNLVTDHFDERCLKLERAPNFAVLHPSG